MSPVWDYGEFLNLLEQSLPDVVFRVPLVYFVRRLVKRWVGGRGTQRGGGTGGLWVAEGPGKCPRAAGVGLWAGRHGGMEVWEALKSPSAGLATGDWACADSRVAKPENGFLTETVRFLLTTKLVY